MITTEEYLISTADRLKEAEARVRALAGELQRIGDELLAKAVEIDTARQVTRQSRSGTGTGSNS